VENVDTSYKSKPKYRAFGESSHVVESS